MLKDVDPLPQNVVVAADAVPPAGVPEQPEVLIVLPLSLKSSSLPVPPDPCDPPLHIRCTFTVPVKLLTAVNAAPVIEIVPVLVPLVPAPAPLPITVPFTSSVQAL